MKIEGLEGDWEFFTGKINEISWTDTIKVFRRIPEKSGLQKWMEYRDMPQEVRYFARLGFYEAIAVVESIHSQKSQESPAAMYTLLDLIDDLKKFAD